MFSVLTTTYKSFAKNKFIVEEEKMANYIVQPLASDITEMLFITANVGSVFEDPLRLQKSWIKTFLFKVRELRPQFFALHLQEIGGKTYEESMKHVHAFIKELCESVELNKYNCITVFVDEHVSSMQHFTALGNLYFSHETISSLRIWNFLTHQWEAIVGKVIYSGNIEAVAIKEKSKFPQDFFPQCKWSRKGFMRTRWEINRTAIDLVNIHLFHDASNLAACEDFPSIYCKTRRRALLHTLKRFHMDTKNGLIPYFVFGDFNFRCDTKGVIKELTGNLTTHRVQTNKTDCTKVQYRNSDGLNVLTVGKKEFIFEQHEIRFKEQWLKKFDRELEAVYEFLIEYPIKFPPSYPYEEDPKMPLDYMSTRCPAWCDRILMSPSAIDLIVNIESRAGNLYNIIGENICMGDHKPIYLHFSLKQNQGTLKYSTYEPHMESNLKTVFDKFLSVDRISEDQIKSTAFSGIVAPIKCFGKSKYIQMKINPESYSCENITNSQNNDHSVFLHSVDVYTGNFLVETSI